MESVQWQLLDADGLEDDEIEYELKVRGSFVTRDNRVQRRKNLQKKFDEERAKRLIPKSQLLLDDSDATQELAICRQKIGNLINLANIEPPNRWSNRARHIKNRLKRLADIVPSADKQCAQVHDELCKCIIAQQERSEKTQTNTSKSSTQNSKTGGTVPKNTTNNTTRSASATPVTSTTTTSIPPTTITMPITGQHLVSHYGLAQHPNIPGASTATTLMPPNPIAMPITGQHLVSHFGSAPKHTATTTGHKRNYRRRAKPLPKTNDG